MIIFFGITLKLVAIGQILKAGARAKALVKQILASSRQTEQEKTPFQPNILTKEALKLLRASIPTTIEFREKICTNCGYIIADPTQIHQHLINLCTNVAHAMEKHGNVLEIFLEPIDSQNAPPFPP